MVDVVAALLIFRLGASGELPEAFEAVPELALAAFSRDMLAQFLIADGLSINVFRSGIRAFAAELRASGPCDGHRADFWSVLIGSTTLHSHIQTRLVRVI